MLVNFVTPNHVSTKRDYFERMTEDKYRLMDISSQFGEEYWDGHRQFGYGGYNDDGRWRVVAEKLAKHYLLTNQSTLLELGCGKGYLLKEFKLLFPSISLCGIDISSYAIENSTPLVKNFLIIDSATSPIAVKDNYYDLLISINMLHNLEIGDLIKTLREIQRVAQKKYIVVESYRNNNELVNLQCWAMTCKSFYSPEAWQYIFDLAGYDGDYEFIFFS